MAGRSRLARLHPLAPLGGDHRERRAGAGGDAGGQSPAGPFKGRIDMRNHRKIVVIDNAITIAAARTAPMRLRGEGALCPWVDIMARFEGPVVRQIPASVRQHLDGAGERRPYPAAFRALARARARLHRQVIASGAAVRYSAMPETFVSLMNTARRELVITTPYYVPDEPIQGAYVRQRRRGVSTTIIFPSATILDSRAAASRSYYRD